MPTSTSTSPRPTGPNCRAATSWRTGRDRRPPGGGGQREERVIVTLKDVAKAAGVSAATVSRALNGKKVDAAMAERVRVAAAELGYRPNAVARNLRRRDTRVWALVITDIANPFYTALARGVEDVAAANGYSLLLCNTDEDAEREARYLEVVEAERVAGVVIASLAADVSRLVDSGVRVVAIDRPLPQAPSIDLVTSASRDGAHEAVRHLLDEGWRRPALLGGPREARTAQERLAGYTDAVTAAGAPVLAAHEPYSEAGGRRGLTALLDADQPPDAVLAANAMLGLGALAICRERGLEVGRDLGLVVFDDAPWARLLRPAVTVVSQDAYGIGARAAQLLVARLAQTIAPEPERDVFPTTLVVRDSSRRSSPA